MDFVAHLVVLAAADAVVAAFSASFVLVLDYQHDSFQTTAHTKSLLLQMLEDASS